MTTIITLDYTLEEIKKQINWTQLPKHVKDFFNKYNSFMIKNFGQELLIYDGRQCMASCSLEKMYTKNKYKVVNLWTKEGNLFEKGTIL